MVNSNKSNILKSVFRWIYRLLSPLILRDYVPEVRRNVNTFLRHCLNDLPIQEPILDIGPQEQSYSTKLFKKNFDYRTLDIDQNADADYIADICLMPEIESETFNTIICTEVLEHTKNPFLAIAELNRILKPSGYLLLSTPFNLRIHGPSPDCWRFTEDGLRILLEANFTIIELKSRVPLLRRQMPIHYTIVAQKSN